jgi:NtrC-family two-component system sensor histidine kinase KinB
MRLATRILLGYWYLVILLLIIAVGAALGFHTLGANIGRVLTENFDSVRASTAMLESLERQDSAVLALLLGKGGEKETLRSSEAAFTEALGHARANITIAEEVTVIEDIESRFAAFTTARDQLLEAAPEYPLRAYEEEAFPKFEIVKSRVIDLLEINHQAMVEADRQAQAMALRRATTLGLLVLLALFSLAFLSRTMNRVLLERLDELAEVAEAIALGRFDRRAAADYPDELGAVARQLNAVLDRQQEFRSTTEGRTALYRELVVALLSALPGPAAVLGLDGRVLVSTLDPAGDNQLEKAAEKVSTTDRSADETELETEDGKVTLQLLRAGAERPIAWLATVTGSH